MNKNHNKKDDLVRIIAQQESKIDMLEAELIYLNQLLVNVGFSNGIQTLKITAEELLVETRESMQS
jgi:hypothetical protein